MVEALERRDVLSAYTYYTTEGVVNTSSGSEAWSWKDPMSSGNTGNSNFTFQGAGFVPVTGDWWGVGQSMWGAVVTSGAHSTQDIWYIPQLDGTILSFGFGGAGWAPVTGRWSGTSNHTGIGAVDTHNVAAANDVWYLRNSLSAGAPDLNFTYGANGWIPVTGNWSNDFAPTGIAAVDPAAFGGSMWYARDTASPGAPSYAPFTYGANSWTPVSGDWNGTGSYGIGMVDLIGGGGQETWYLRNSVGSGSATTVPYGASYSTPVTATVNPRVIPNWAGYLVDGNATFVQGSWVVPTVNDSANRVASAWVGLNGDTNQMVEQIGTTMDPTGTNDYTWFELYGDTDGHGNRGQYYYPTKIPEVSASPGDSMTASVGFVGYGLYVSTFAFTITNNTTHQTKSFTVHTDYTLILSPTSAEWIVEKPTAQNGQPQYQLGKFDPVTFTNCSATINGNGGSIEMFNYPNHRSPPGPVPYMVAMMEPGLGGTLLATTSALDSTGGGFTVSYVAGGTGYSIVRPASVFAGALANPWAENGGNAVPAGNGNARLPLLADHDNPSRQIGLVRGTPSPAEMLFALAHEKSKSSQPEFDQAGAVLTQPIDTPLDV
jgi:hypothetical protein